MTEFLQKKLLLESECWPVILCFFERFGQSLGMPTKFQNIENVALANKCSESVVAFFHKLLQSFGQRLLKRYYKSMWEKALLAFAEMYDVGLGCVETLRKGGYFALSVTDRLPLIKDLCEAQFDVCASLKDKVNSDSSAEELRLKPLIQDKDGHKYWLFVDTVGQFALYKELGSMCSPTNNSKMEVIACTLDELDQFLLSLRPQSEQVKSYSGGNKSNKSCSDEDRMSGDESAIGEFEVCCEICHVDRHPEKLLLCDSCDSGYHFDCLSPPLSKVPLGDWHCMSCLQDRLYTAIEEKQKDIINLVRKAERSRRQEAKCLKLEEEAIFFAGLSSGRRTRSNHQMADNNEFYSYKAFDHAIQKAIYQNETKSARLFRGSVNGTQTFDRDRSIAALCDPTRRQTRAVSKFASMKLGLQNVLRPIQHEKDNENSGSESSDSTVVRSRSASSDGLNERDSLYTCDSRESESEEIVTSDSPESCSDGQTQHSSQRIRHNLQPVSRVNGTFKQSRASSRVAYLRLTKHLQSTQLEAETDEDDSESEVASAESSVSDDNDETYCESSSRTMPVRHLLRNRTRILACLETSDDSSSDILEQCSPALEGSDGESEDSSSSELEDSSTMTWGRKRHAMWNGRSTSVSNREQDVLCTRKIASGHHVPKDHCYAQLKIMKVVAEEPSQLQTSKRTLHELVPGKREDGSPCHIISASNAVDMI